MAEQDAISEQGSLEAPVEVVSRGHRPFVSFGYDFSPSAEFQGRPSIVISDPLASYGGIASSGRVYRVNTRNQVAWTLNGQEGELFGKSVVAIPSTVAVPGLIAIGAPASGEPLPGRVVLCEEEGGSLYKELGPPSGYARFGKEMAVSGPRTGIEGSEVLLAVAALRARASFAGPGSPKSIHPLPAVVVIDVASGQILRAVDLGFSGEVASLQFIDDKAGSTKASLLLAVAESGEVALVDVSSGKILQLSLESGKRSRVPSHVRAVPDLDGDGQFDVGFAYDYSGLKVHSSASDEEIFAFDFLPPGHWEAGQFEFFYGSGRHLRENCFAYIGLVDVGGRVALVSASNGLVWRVDVGLPGSRMWMAGTTLRTIDDIDGDGLPEALVGGEHFQSQSPGVVYLLSSRDGHVMHEWAPPLR